MTEEQGRYYEAGTGLQGRWWSRSRNSASFDAKPARMLDAGHKRTKAGPDKARSNGKTLGTPRKMTDLKVEMAKSFRRDGLSLEQIGTALGVSRTTVARPLRDG